MDRNPGDNSEEHAKIFGYYTDAVLAAAAFAHNSVVQIKTADGWVQATGTEHYGTPSDAGYGWGDALKHMNDFSYRVVITDDNGKFFGYL